MQQPLRSHDPFRDAAGAALERAARLEEENRLLRDQVAALAAPRPVQVRPLRQSSVQRWRLVTVALVMGIVAGMGTFTLLRPARSAAATVESPACQDARNARAQHRPHAVVKQLEAACRAGR
jgi:hypothetical protein